MAARQAGRSITTAPNDDDSDSESLVDMVMTKNTRRNRSVSFELPYWLSDGSSELDATEASCVLCDQISGITHGNADGFCQRCWREAMNGERAARIIRANEESQATPRAQEQANIQRVLSEELVFREEITGGSMNDI